MALRIFQFLVLSPVVAMPIAFFLRIAARCACGFWMKYWNAYKVSLLVLITTSIFLWIIKAVLAVSSLFENNKETYYALVWLLPALLSSYLLGVHIINPNDERRVGIIGGVLTFFSIP